MTGNVQFYLAGAESALRRFRHRMAAHIVRKREMVK